jgi:ABC-type arginine/histidine transport system permease subunit
MAAQRAAGEAFAGTLNEQLRPSAVRPALPPVAKAALVAVMQDTSSAAMTISIINLMDRFSPQNYPDSGGFYPTTTAAHGRLRQIGPVLA